MQKKMLAANRRSYMGLTLIVLVKQIPDTRNFTGEAMKKDGTVNRAALCPPFSTRRTCMPLKRP
jgi:hypothetical protein